LIKPAFRYSISRDAYILRRIGERRGPKLLPAARGRAMNVRSA
jgi:hypothetical protein